MPSLASGNRSCTACASTCAVECRSTLRPSGDDSATGSTGVSVSGAQSRSRSVPDGSRTTTIAFGPVVGSPAAAIASALVVPGATTTRAASAWVLTADTVNSLLRGTGTQAMLSGRAHSPAGDTTTSGYI